MTQKFITGAETRVSYVAETTPGTTPVTPSMTVLPFVKTDLELVKNAYEDTSVFADRQEHEVIMGLQKVSGSIEGNLSATNFSPILESALWNQWSTNTLKVGTAIQTMTFEEWHSDAATPFGRVATGCFADKLAVKMAANGIVTFTATLAGFNLTTSTSALSATPTVPAVEVPYTCVAATVQEGGSAIAYLTSFDFTLDNKSAAVDAMGSQNPLTYVPGMAKLTGTASFYIPDTSLYTKFLDSTSSSIQVELTDGTNTLTFLLPNVTYTGVKMPVQGQGAIIGQFSFTAVKDASAGSNLVITKS